MLISLSGNFYNIFLRPLMTPSTVVFVQGESVPPRKLTIDSSEDEADNTPYPEAVKLRKTSTQKR